MRTLCVEAPFTLRESDLKTFYTIPRRMDNIPCCRVEERRLSVAEEDPREADSRLSFVSANPKNLRPLSALAPVASRDPLTSRDKEVQESRVSRVTSAERLSTLLPPRICQ